MFLQRTAVVEVCAAVAPASIEAVAVQCYPRTTRGKRGGGASIPISMPDDICSWADAPKLHGSIYRVQPRSVVFLAVKAEEERALLV
jgi:hypothetical protein